MAQVTSASTSTAAVLSDRRNERCLCVTLDRKLLADALNKEAEDPAFSLKLFGERSNLFSPVQVFLSAGELSRIQAIVHAIEVTARLPRYQKAVLGWAPEIAQADFGPVGAFMGYDFHLDDSGPRLIEVNTNAGGAFLNATLARAQKACCGAASRSLMEMQSDNFDSRVFEMFKSEWLLQRGYGVPGRIAIIDDRPEQQYLYPEFVLARQLLSRHGMSAVIGDARDLRYRAGKLQLDGMPIDLVYNRLVDFAFVLPEHAALAAAYREGAVVVTPNPHNHALHADKRNLTLLSDSAVVRAFGLPDELLAQLGGIPRTVLVKPENAGSLWRDRKHLFFKPVSGYGGKAVYRGDKVTKSVWEEITRGGYVAQTLVPPGNRMIELDGELTQRKMDIRLYTYAGQTLLSAARLYQGQTTNFRTPGGGFAPVFVMAEVPRAA